MAKNGRLARIKQNGRCYCPAGVIDCVQEYARVASDNYIIPKILSIAESTINIDKNGEEYYTEIKSVDQYEGSKIAWRKNPLPKNMLAHFESMSFDELVKNIEYGFEKNIDDILVSAESRKEVCKSIINLFNEAKNQIIHEEIKAEISKNFNKYIEDETKESFCKYLALNLAFVVKYTDNISNSNPWEKINKTIQPEQILQVNNPKLQKGTFGHFMDILYENSYVKTTKLKTFRKLCEILFEVNNEQLNPSMSSQIIRERRRLPREIMEKKRNRDEIKKNIREFIKTINIEKATVETYFLMNGTDISVEQKRRFKNIYSENEDDFFLEYVIFIFENIVPKSFNT